MSFWDDLKSKAEQVVKKAEETFEDVKESTSTEYQVLKFKRQISLCEGEIKELQNKIGKRVYDLQACQPPNFQPPETRDSEIQNLCSAITEQLKQIAGFEKEVIDVREKAAKQDPGPSEGPPPAGGQTQP